MVRQGNKGKSSSGGLDNHRHDLLNFHFSVAPPRASSSSHATDSNRRRRAGGGGGNKRQQQYKRTDEDRASARKKAQSSMFYLHSSADHAFLISRKTKNQQIGDGYAYTGPDVAVPWDAVRMVKYLVPRSQKWEQRRDDKDNNDNNDNNDEAEEATTQSQQRNDVVVVVAAGSPAPQQQHKEDASFSTPTTSATCSTAVAAPSPPAAAAVAAPSPPAAAAAVTDDDEDEDDDEEGTRTRTTMNNCPICLDSLICARITKCGHCFCLPCLLRHVQTSAETNPSMVTKCPCCALPLHLDDIRPVLFHDVQNPASSSSHPPPPPASNSATTGRGGAAGAGAGATTKSHGHKRRRFRLIKLHRHRGCPAPFLPKHDAMQHRSPHAAPRPTDADANFSRFLYYDTAHYLDHLRSNREELERQVTTLPPSDLELLFLRLSLERVQTEYRTAQLEEKEEQTWVDRFENPESAIYLPISSELIAKQGQIVEDDAAATDENNDDDGCLLGKSAEGEHDSTAECGEGKTLFESSAMSTTTTTTSLVDAEKTETPVDQTVLAEEEGLTDIVVRSRSESLGSSRDTRSGTTITATQFPSSSSRLGRPRRGYSIDSADVIVASSTGRNNGHGHGSAASTSNPHHHLRGGGGNGGGNTRRRRSQQTRKLPNLPASVYLDDEDTTQFYQAADGQLCFLSKLNMNCLVSDFSTHRPSEKTSMIERQGQEENREGTPSQRRKSRPLPDEVEGRVLDIETVHLTPDMRKRLIFLSHLPLYIDVRFVELDLNPILSDETRQKFKADFEARQRKRRQRQLAEKRTDEAARRKEEERINELKSRYQRIDPDDDFFHVTPTPTHSIAEEETLTEQDFPPPVRDDAADGDGGNAATTAMAAALPPSAMAPSPTQQNSHRTTSDNPSTTKAPTTPRTPPLSFRSALATTARVVVPRRREEEFPALGSSPMPPPTPTPAPSRTASWGPGWHESNMREKTLEGDGQQHLSSPSGGGGGESAATTGSPPRTSSNSGLAPIGKGKKGKGKKVLLFSTGGHRGSAY